MTQVPCRIFYCILLTVSKIVKWALHLFYGGHGKIIPPITNTILLESATTLAHKIRSQDLTSVEVVKSFIYRIEETNKYINAVAINRFVDALEEAKKADELVKFSGKSEAEIKEELPFLGVPFTVKSTTAVLGLPQTCGVYYRKNHIAEEDAEVVRLLRGAGGIPLAVTNVPELCLFWECHNTIYGRTKNPYDTNRNPGGSSGGEAAILAAGGSPVGLGTDLGGSIRAPAFLCGVFGHKGSSGSVSWKGNFPIPDVVDFRKLYCVGPMSRFACDLRNVFKVISSSTERHLLRLDEQVDVSKLNFFYMDDDGGGYMTTPVETEIKESIWRVILYLKKTYGITAKKVNFASLKESMTLWYSKLAQSGDSQIKRDLGNGEVMVNPFVELLKLPFRASKHTFSAIVTCIAETLVNDVGSASHKAHLASCEELRAKFEHLLATNGVFIYPTLPTAAQYHNMAQLMATDIGYCAIFNALGLPATQCPMGLNKDGLPIGIQIIGAHNQDRLTLAVAEELEKAFGGWVPPSPNKI